MHEVSKKNVVFPPLRQRNWWRKLTATILWWFEDSACMCVGEVLL